MPETADRSVDVEAGPRDGRSRSVRLTAFVRERFLPVPQLVLLVVMWLAGVLLPGTTVVRDAEIEWLPLALSLVGFLLFSFHLRVMDDVKDADHDRVHETDRPIPRGLVVERELDALWVALVAIEAALFAAVGELALTAWAIAAAFSVLMRFEFFAPKFIDEHVLTFAISHMAIMPMMFALLLASGFDAINGWASVTIVDLYSDWLLLACLASFCIGMGFELGRKFERYYDEHHGRAWVLWVLFPCSGALLFTYLAREHYNLSTELTLGGISFVAILLHARTWARRPLPDPESSADLGAHVRERIELYPAVAGLFVYLALALSGILAVVD